MNEVKVIFERLQSSYDSSLIDVSFVFEGVKDLYGFHERSTFNTTLSSLCVKNRGLRQAVIAIVCKTSAISRSDGYVGIKDDGQVIRRFLEFITPSSNESEFTGTFDRLCVDLCQTTLEDGPKIEDWVSLASSVTSTGKEEIGDDKYVSIATVCESSLEAPIHVPIQTSLQTGSLDISQASSHEYDDDFDEESPMKGLGNKLDTSILHKKNCIKPYDFGNVTEDDISTFDLLSRANEAMGSEQISRSHIENDYDAPVQMQKAKRSKKKTNPEPVARTDENQRSQQGGPKVVKRLRKAVQRSVSASSVDEFKVQNAEKKVNDLRRALSVPKFGVVDLLKMLREKSAAALEIVFKANNILNNKLNSAYKVAVGLMHQRHEQEITELDIYLENERSNVAISSSGSRHRADIFRNRLREKQQMDSEVLWQSLQPPMQHLDEVYSLHVRTIQEATDHAVAVASRATELIERRGKESGVKGRELLTERMNEQTRDAVLSCMDKIADVCAGIKHIYDSLNTAVFTHDGNIRGLEIPPMADVEGTLNSFESHFPAISPRMSCKKKNVKVSNKKVLLQSKASKASKVLESFNNVMTGELLTHARYSEKKSSESNTNSVNLEPIFSPTGDSEKQYDSDFETTISPQKQSESEKGVSLKTMSPSSYSPTKVAANDSNDYEEDFEEASPKSTHTSNADGPSDDISALFDALGIDPDSLADNIVSSGAARVTVVKKKESKKEKKIFNAARISPLLDQGDTSKCTECSKIFSGDGKTIPNLKNLDQPAVEVVANMLAENADMARRKRKDSTKVEEGCNSTKIPKTFCSWRCAKNWNKRNTPLQLRYHTDVMIDFAAALQASSS